MDNEAMLCRLLDCGYRDLELLDDVEYEIDSIFDVLDDMGCEKPTINDVMYAVFDLVKNDVQEKINEIIEDKKSELDESEDELNDLNSSLDDKKDELNDLNAEIDDTNLEIESLEEEDDEEDDEEDKENRKVKISEKEDHVRELEFNKENLENEISDLDDDIIKAQEKIEDLESEIDDLESLDPQEDIISYHNFIDTSIDVSTNEEIYRKYDEIDELVNEKTGFNLF